MTYRKQGNEPTCGPYVLYNLMVWAGKKKRLGYIKRVLGYKDGWGLYSSHINQALGRFSNIKVTKKILYPRLAQLDEAIDKGCAIVLNYYGHEGHQGHYTLCIDRTDKYYTLVNDSSKGPAVRRYSRKTVSRMIRRKYEEFAMTTYPCAWIVKRT